MRCPLKDRASELLPWVGRLLMFPMQKKFWPRLGKISKNWMLSWLVGKPQLLFDAEAVLAALPDLKARNNLTCCYCWQVTFTDATMTVELGKEIDAPLVMWSFPEARTGGRLRHHSLRGQSGQPCIESQ